MRDSKLTDDDRSTDDAGEYRRTCPSMCVRAYDFELRSVSGDGRTIEGYVVPFGSVARIPDRNGDFDEEMHRGVFARSLASRGMPVMQFEHGRDVRVGALPIGTYSVWEPDHKGYFSRGHLLDDPLIEPIRKAIADGAVKGQSWRMGVPDNGQRWTRGRNGSVDKRDVLDADLFEAGPVVFPAYASTTVSVRSMLAAMSPDEIRSLVHELAAHLGLAVDLTGLTGRPDARRAGGGDNGDDGPGSAVVPTQTTELRTTERALQALGVLTP